MYIGYLQRGQLWWYYEKNLFLRHGSQNEWPHTNVTGCNSVYKHIGQSNIFILNNWANEYFKNKNQNNYGNNMLKDRYCYIRHE